MQETLKELLEKIDLIQEQIKDKYAELAKEYGYVLEKRRVQFQDLIRLQNKSHKTSFWRYILSKNTRQVLSIPFIYVMIVPAVVLDIFLLVYQWTAFPLYRIPRVKRGEYILFDRKYLDYLNWFDKLNCLYCSYVNGLFAYAVEIAARTERYWCPIKAATKPRFTHTWYKEFADYGNPKEWKKKFNDEWAFVDSFGDIVPTSSCKR